jgi:hypothetical protein
MTAGKRFRIAAGVALAFVLTLSGTAYAQGQKKQDPPKEQDTKQDVKQDQNVADALQPSDIGAGWRVTDFEPYVKSLKELEKIGKDYSETVLKQAIDEYATGIDILQDMESEILKTKAAYEKGNNLNERWYWQEIDRKNEQARHVAFVKIEAKMKSITHFTRAINYLDNVQAIEVRKDPKYVGFQVQLFRAYISTQYDLHNLKPCIPILERYIAINDKTKADPWAYKYMASCYGFMEIMLTKYNQSSDDVMIQYKAKKNAALLKAVEIQYGIESPQYQQLKDVVELDEKKTEKISDFK